LFIENEFERIEKKITETKYFNYQRVCQSDDKVVNEYPIPVQMSTETGKKIIDEFYMNKLYNTNTLRFLE
jgi:hypothetical protein